MRCILKYSARFKGNCSIALMRGHVDACLYAFWPAYPPYYFKENSSRDCRLIATTCHETRAPQAARVHSLRRVARRWFSNLASKHTRFMTGIGNE